MFTKQRNLASLLLATLVLGCVGTSDGDDGDIHTTGADSDTDVIMSELAPLVPPQRCERMNAVLSPLVPNVPSSTSPIPKPYVARIINGGRQISCSPSNTGDISTTFTFTETLEVPVGTRFSVSRGSIAFVPRIPAQETSLFLQGVRYEGRVLPNPIQTIGCITPMTDVTTPGFPDRRVPAYSTLRVLTTPTNGKFTFECQVHLRGPVSAVRDRPTDVVATSADRFTYRCDVAAAQRKSVCAGNICSFQCTANVTAPIDVAGVNQCIDDCSNRCAAASCGPPLCTGSDCPSGCPAANVCTSSAQCTGGKICNAGCCITIIH